jgi:hypothetical protein
MIRYHYKNKLPLTPSYSIANSIACMPQRAAGLFELKRGNNEISLFKM